MKYGCIGEKLSHSFSKEIHARIADYDYDLHELARNELENFAKEKNFSAINVTIPYKELIIPYLDEIENNAKKIGAVNTVVNKGGRLYGYNTDFYGMKMLFAHAKIDVCGKKVAILGTGGTSKTARAVATELGAKDIVMVSRVKKEGSVDYGELHSAHSDTEVIINTTPKGMFPSVFDMPVSLTAFPALCGVIDAIYNPLRTELVSDAKRRGIKAEGGLYMLVAQAVRASEIFLDTVYDEEIIDTIYEKMVSAKENVVLIGMPSSGKSTVGRLIANKLNRTFADTDELIIEKAKMPIADIFEKYGERYFRDLESEVIKEISSKHSLVIATGGGAVLRKENTDTLKKNGRLYFLDRPLENLMFTPDRPLSRTREDVQRIYNERYPIYQSSADKIIDASPSLEDVCDSVTEDFL